jgi:hypothetical protein
MDTIVDDQLKEIVADKLMELLETGPLLVKKEVFKCLDSLVDRLNHDSIVELLM